MSFGQRLEADAKSGFWDRDVTPIRGREPELVLEVMRYRLETVKFTSTPQKGLDSTILDLLMVRGSGMGLLVSPWLCRRVLDLLPVDETVMCLGLRMEDL